MQTQVRKSTGKVIPIRRFDVSPNEEIAPQPRKANRHREEILSEHIVATLKNLLRSLRTIKT